MGTRNENLEIVIAGWVDARRREDIELARKYLHPDPVWQGLRRARTARSASACTSLQRSAVDR